jgi:hypothetical protein
MFDGSRELATIATLLSSLLALAWVISIRRHIRPSASSGAYPPGTTQAQVLLLALIAIALTLAIGWQLGRR